MVKIAVFRQKPIWAERVLPKRFLTGEPLKNKENTQIMWGTYYMYVPSMENLAIFHANRNRFYGLGS